VPERFLRGLPGHEIAPMLPGNTLDATITMTLGATSLASPGGRKRARRAKGFKSPFEFGEQSSPEASPSRPTAI
jgi:hypothetical protein